MIQKKKYAKAAKIIPDGYESANHFFEQMNCILVTMKMCIRQ